MKPLDIIRGSAPVKPIVLITLGIVACGVAIGVRATSASTAWPAVLIDKTRSFFAGASSNDRVKATGEVVSREVVVSAKASGRLEKLLVDEGSTVAAGDALAVFESKDLRAEYASYQAQVTHLEARLQQARESHTLEDDRSKNQLTQSEAQRDVARGELTKAQAELEQARRDADRFANLAQSGIISRSEHERSATQVVLAEAQVRALENKVRAAEADMDVRKSNLRQTLVVAEDVNAVAAQLAQAKAQLSQTRIRLDEAIVYAPTNGTVSIRVASAGEIIRAGDPIVTIVNLDDLWVKVDVDESLVGQLAPKDEVLVRLVSGEIVKGNVMNIAAEGDFATRRDVNRERRDIKTFAVRVRIPNPDHRIHAGMTAWILIPDTPSGKGSRTTSIATEPAGVR